jgi:hypothetical protein
MFLELTGTGGGTLVVPNNRKLYYVYNNTASGTVTVKVSGQTGVQVPNGAKVVMVCNGTDVVPALTALSWGNFTMVESGGELQINYGATTIMSIDSSGNVVFKGDITAYGTP